MAFEKKTYLFLLLFMALIASVNIYDILFSHVNLFNPFACVPLRLIFIAFFSFF